jgi:hypothetical protein
MRVQATPIAAWQGGGAAVNARQDTCRRATLVNAACEAQAGGSQHTSPANGATAPVQPAAAACLRPQEAASAPRLACKQAFDIANVSGVRLSAASVGQRQQGAAADVPNKPAGDDGRSTGPNAVVSQAQQGQELLRVPPFGSAVANGPPSTGLLAQDATQSAPACAPMAVHLDSSLHVSEMAEDGSDESLPEIDSGEEGMAAL